MNYLFIKILSMSISACTVIVEVIFFSLVLRKVPKWINCLLWAFVGIKLVCPLTFESKIEIIPSAETVQNVITHDETRVNAAKSSICVPVIIWISGMAALILYGIISYLKVKKLVAASVISENSTRVCDDVKTPFILGIFRPVIYLPSSLPEKQSVYVIIHEKTHIRRLDFLWKPVGFVLLAAHWFNPLCWLAYFMFCNDIEMACDERIIAGLSKNERINYAQTLLDLSSAGNVSASVLAFGKNNTKARIKRILNYQKTPWGIVTCTLVIGVAIIIVNMLGTKKIVPEQIKTYPELRLASETLYKALEAGQTPGLYAWKINDRENCLNIEVYEDISGEQLVDILDLASSVRCTVSYGKGAVLYNR